MRPVTTLEDLLYHVEKRIYSKYWKYAEIDEYLQEARIHAWQDFEDGGFEDREQIVRRAANRVRNLITKGTNAAPTGKPVKDKQIYARPAGEQMREKIRSYMSDYRAIHGELPTQTQIAVGVGTSIANVSRHMKRLHMFTNPIGDVEVVSLPFWVEEGFFNPGTVDKNYGAFETDTVLRLHVADYVSRLPEKERLAIYYRFWEDRTNKGVAVGLGTGSSDQSGLNWVNKGLSRLRTLMNADTAP
jgi:hypothetical protein